MQLAFTMAGCAGCAGEVQLEDTFCARCGAPVTDPFIGTVVGERYRIVSRIGIGGMGAVYRAEHTMMRRDLAIKVLLPELGGKEEFARRFEREAESASRLDHPNIITVTDFGRTADGALFLVMEYLAGESLTHAISADLPTLTLFGCQLMTKPGVANISFHAFRIASVVVALVAFGGNTIASSE